MFGCREHLDGSSVSIGNRVTEVGRAATAHKRKFAINKSFGCSQEERQEAPTAGVIRAV